MTIFRLTAIAFIAVGLAACEASAPVEMTADGPLNGTCTDPRPDRDNFYVRLLQDDSLDAAAKIARAEEGIISHGGNPADSGSFTAFEVRVTGDASVLAKQQDVADYYACLTPLL